MTTNLQSNRPVLLAGCSAGLFSFATLLTLDGKEIGVCRRRMVSESMDLELEDGRSLVIRRKGFWGGEFELGDSDSGEIFGRAVRSGGIFRRTWTLTLDVGVVEFRPIGFLRRFYSAAFEDGREVATVRSTGWVGSSWEAQSNGDLSLEELLLIGLLYHLLVRRRRRQSS